MKRLLSIDLIKIWNNKASRVLTLAYFIILTSIALIASLEFNFGAFDIKISEMGIFNFPYIWHFNTYIAAFFKLLLAIVIVSMMANEYSYGTLKQNLIDGLSKKEFILSKFLTIVLFALASTIFVFLFTLVLGYQFSTNTDFGKVFSELAYLPAYFIKLVSFFSFCLFLGILVKRSAFAFAFLFVWNIIEGIGQGILKHFIFPEGKTAAFIIKLFPLESMSNLIVEPFTRLSLVKSIGTQMGVENLKDYSVHFLTVLIGIAWIFIFNFTSYKILKNRDL